MNFTYTRPPRTSKDTPNPRQHPYLDWLRMQPCYVCGQLGSEAAHVREAISAKTGKRLPRRNREALLAAIPLCAGCHRTDRDSIHNMGEAAWAEKHLHPNTLAQLALTYLARWAMQARRPY